MNKILLFLLLFLSFNSNAYELYYNENTFIKKIDLNGYMGYRYMWSTLEDIIPVKSGPEIGLVSTIKFNDNWQIYLQGMHYDNIDNLLTYGFLEYYSNSNSLVDIRFQAGKIRREYGLHNKYLHNPSTRPGGIVPPQGIYRNQFENFLNSGYGLKFEMTCRRFKLGGSVLDPFVDEDEITNIIIDPIPDDSEFTDGYNIWSSFQVTPKLLINVTYNYLYVNDRLSNIDTITGGFIYSGADWDISIEGLLLKASAETDFVNDWRFGVAKSLVFIFNKDINDNWSYNLSGYYHVGVRDRIQFFREFTNAPKSIEYSWDFGVGLTYTDGPWQAQLTAHYVKGGNKTTGSDWISGENFKNWGYSGASLVYHW